MKMPKFKTEAEEADWLYEHREEIKREWKPVRDEHGKPMTPAQILKRKLTNDPAKNLTK